MERCCRRRKRGFTLVEFLVVFFLGLLIATLIFQWFLEYVGEQQFQAGVVEATSLIREARQQTLAAEGDRSYGIHFATSTITTFRGQYFDPADPTNSASEIAGIIISPSLTAGTSSVSFTRLSGVPSATGTILFRNVQSGATTSLTILGTGIIE